jgi:hypothetical protein
MIGVAAGAAPAAPAGRKQKKAKKKATNDKETTTTKRKKRSVAATIATSAAKKAKTALANLKDNNHEGTGATADAGASAVPRTNMSRRLATAQLLAVQLPTGEFVQGNWGNLLKPEWYAGKVSEALYDQKKQSWGYKIEWKDASHTGNEDSYWKVGERHHEVKVITEVEWQAFN